MRRLMRRRFLTDRRGMTAVEFALVAPLMVLLVTGLAELGRYGMFRLELGQAAFAMADMTARGRRASEAEILDIVEVAMRAVDRAGDPARWRVHVGAVVRTGDDTQPRVAWRVTAGTLTPGASRVGAVGGDAAVPADLVSDEVPAAIVAEILVDYAPLFGRTVIGHEVYEASAMRPRRAELDTLDP
ncbi:MAG: TadE/TadG family type IV pilus assembly protein [Paracoccaceae bacterium]